MELRHICGNTYTAVGTGAIMGVYRLNERDVVLLDTGVRQKDRAGLDAMLDENHFTVKGIFCSHAHYDHADGMDTFFSLNQEAPFLVREGTRENCFGIKDGVLHYIGIQSGILKQHEARIQYVDGVYKIADGLWLVPHRKSDYTAIAMRNDLYTVCGQDRRPDDFAHEQSLVVETEKGLVVFSSCSHAGMTNILADISEMLGREDVYAYVGGLHLYKMTDEELDLLCGEIQRTAIEHIFTGHCTGDHAFNYLQGRLGPGIRQFSSGFRYAF